MKSLVSVVIPCHNGENLVGRAIQSVLSQSYQQFEIILIENNSTDNTLAILKQYAAQYPDKISVYVEQKKGACAARNLGLAHAKGDWIQFLDADDELLPQKIEKQMTIAAMDGADIIIDDYVIYHSVTKEPYITMVAENDAWAGLINSRLGITSANLWKKEKLVKVNGWNEALNSSQEYDLMFRLFKLNCRSLMTHQVQTKVHAQQNSVSRTKSNKKLFKLYESRYVLRSRIFNFLEENSLLKKNYRIQLETYIYYYLLLIRELNISYFNTEIKKYSFQELSVKAKLKILKKFIGHSSRRKYGQKNLLIKAIEWQYFFIKNVSLLRY